MIIIDYQRFIVILISENQLSNVTSLHQTFWMSVTVKSDASIIFSSPKNKNKKKQQKRKNRWERFFDYIGYSQPVFHFEQYRQVPFSFILNFFSAFGYGFTRKYRLISVTGTVMVTVSTSAN